jgi:ABC-type transport system involved in cytochrome bd biosynthesis fused ATPase/permease subunit
LNVCSRARDEPTSGLNEQTAARLLDDVLLNTGDQSLLYITHRPTSCPALTT